jgi:hypothetical protein
MLFFYSCTNHLFPQPAIYFIPYNDFPTHDSAEVLGAKTNHVP